MLYLIILAIFSALAIADAVTDARTATERNHAPAPYTPDAAPRKAHDARSRRRAAKPYENPYQFIPYRAEKAPPDFTQYRRPAHPIATRRA